MQAILLQFFWLKKRNLSIKFCEKIILWRRHLYHEVDKLSQNFIEGNTRKVFVLCVNFVCMFVSSYNFETTTPAYQRPTGSSGMFEILTTNLFADISLHFIACDFRVDFLKLIKYANLWSYRCRRRSKAPKGRMNVTREIIFLKQSW